MSIRFCLFTLFWLRSVYARRLIALVIMAVLTGCGPVSFVKETPLRTQMAEITPGSSTREDIRKLLGEPLYSSFAWDAELYSGNVVRQRLLDVLCPIPFGTELESATLLVVYGPSDIVSGVTYHGSYGEPNCPNDCRLGDTRGLEIQNLHVLLASPAESAHMLNISGTDDVCTLMVVAAEGALCIGVGGIESGLYLDQRFLQLVTNEGYFRLEIPPGKHELSCLTEGVWDQNTIPQLPQPGHHLVLGKRSSVINYPFECEANETRYFRLENQEGRFVGPMKCVIEPTDKPDFLNRTQHLRLVIVPDAVGKAQ